MDFEARLEALYNEIPMNRGNAVDVGAHLGRHTLPLARNVGTSGVVHAFEPIPMIRQQLVGNAVAAAVNNIVVYPFALSDENGLAEFRYIPNLPEESGLRARHVYNAPPDPVQLIPVQQHRLDDLLPNATVSFVKIDIEGGEFDMLRGAQGLLRRSRPVVAFECGAASYLGYHDRPQDLFEIFAGIGFRVYSILGHPIENAATFRRLSIEQEFWDYIAAPIERCAQIESIFSGPLRF